MTRRPIHAKPTRPHDIHAGPTGARLSLLVVVLTLAGAIHGAAQAPLIQRAEPDAARRIRSAAWLDHFGRQTPALLRAVVALDGERDHWRSSPGVARCRRALLALGEVDRGGLLRVADYRLASAVGGALDELDGAARACLERRYFELDYRLGLARRSLDQARDLAREQAGR